MSVIANRDPVPPSVPPSVPPAVPATAPDAELLPGLAAAVEAAGACLATRFDPAARPSGAGELWSALAANDDASLAVLRPALTALRPAAGWVEDELESAPLPPGEWWVVDPAEGNVNHVHGLPDWCVTATLIRDGRPAATAVSFPLTGRTYTARAGGGAWVGERRLAVSAERDLAAAFVATAQAAPTEPAAARTRIGRSVEAMLQRAMVVRLAVPATVGLVAVAEGHVDAFWQFSPIVSGLAAGALLVGEAGGAVTGAAGEPWRPGDPDLLATAPDLHAAAVDVLGSLR